MTEDIETTSTADEAAAATPTTTDSATNGKSGAAASATPITGITTELRRLPLAGLGLVATISDETVAVVNKLSMRTLVARGEQVQKDAAQVLKDVQARFR